MKRFDELKVFLLEARGEGNFEESAARLGMTAGAVKVLVHRLRRRYREIFRDEIAETVSRPEEIADEIRHLLAALA